MYKRVASSYFLLMLIFGFLMINLFLICINISTQPSSLSTNSRSTVLATSRGMIYDCNMKKIVNGTAEYTAVSLPTSQALNLLLPFLNDSDKQTVYENTTQGKVSIVPTKEIFDEDYLKTVSLAKRYASNQSCIHLIGHLDENGNGAMGLEKAYNNFLSDSGGTLSAKWSADALGHILLGDKLSIENDGYLSPMGIQLTIDLDIQKIGEKALEDFNVTKGAVVIINAETSEILACASVPEFDHGNLEDGLKSPDSPFLNRAICSYCVGSVFKPFVASVALENNINFTYECVGSINIQGSTFKCSNNKAHGYVNMKTATEMSCNCYFIALGQKLGGKKILNLCKSLKFGESLELADNFIINGGQVPTENDLLVPQALANFSFGQGNLLVSPVQMACAYACFANGGFYREPTLMKAIIDENGNAVQKVELPEKYRVLNDSTVEKMNDILESVVSNGNGNKAYSQIVTNHGKTATAQSGWFENGIEITHTWFCGYFSVKDTKYVAVILKEDGTSGAVDCAPIFKELSEEIYKVKNYVNKY